MPYDLSIAILCNLDEIDTTGERTDEPLDYRFDEIIAVQWGTDYLRALAMLAEG